MGDETWHEERGDEKFAAFNPNTGMRVDSDPRAENLAILPDSPEPAPEAAAPCSAAASNGDLAAVIRLQSTELERVVLENERLMSRLDIFFQLHENDQRMRQELQEQILCLNQRAEAAAPAYDIDALRRDTRECMIQEIRPVLVAILDLLERSLPEPGREPGRAPPQPARNPPPTEEFLHLPKILTRPLEELAGLAEETPARRHTAAVPAEVRNGDTQIERPKRQVHKDGPDKALPSVFAWTSLFSQEGTAAGSTTDRADRE